MAVSGWGCVLLAAMLLMLPLPWLMGAVAAAAVHELCHAAAVRLLGGKIGNVAVGPRGAVMEVAGLTLWGELLAAAAGPAGSLLLLTFSRIFPRLSICALVQGLYNLLPIYPLDGGRILCCLLKFRMEEGKALRLCGWVGLAAGSALGIFLLRQGLYPGAMVVFWVALRNIPCKDGKGIVQ